MKYPLLRICWTLALPALAMTAWCYEPYVHDGPVLCLWRRAFDVECPGCGLTRAVCLFTHGRIIEAMQFNPLIAAIVPAGIGIWLHGCRNTKWRRSATEQLTAPPRPCLPPTCARTVS